MKALKYVVMAVLLVCAFAMAGCGSDKFVGNWYKVDKYGATQLAIEKNGKGYIINETYFGYKADTVMVNKKEYEESWKGLTPFGNSEPKPKRLKPIYDVKLKWETSQGKSYTGTEKDGKIAIDGFNGFVNIVYIEKDNTIRLENKTYEKEGKVNAKNLKELLKEDAKKRTVEHITRYKTQEVRNVEFVDAQ